MRTCRSEHLEGFERLRRSLAQASLLKRNRTQHVNKTWKHLASFLGLFIAKDQHLQKVAFWGLGDAGYSLRVY